MIEPYETIRQQYNAMSELQWRSQFATQIPSHLSPPESFDDYLQLSDFILCGYEHACAIGEWCHNGDRSDHTSRKAIERIAFSVFGMNLIHNLLNDADRFDSLKPFNAVSPLPLSMHVQLRLAIEQQNLALLVLYADLIGDGIGLKELASCSPQWLEVYRDHFMVDTWHDPDPSQKILIARAELAKVELHLKSHSFSSRKPVKTRGPVNEARDEEIYQLWLQNKSIVKAWNSWNSTHYGEDQLEYETFRKALKRYQEKISKEQQKAVRRDK